MNDSTIRLSADTSALTDSLSKIAEEMTAMKDAVSSSAAAMGVNLDASAKQAEATNAAIHGLDESVKTVTDSIEAQTKTVTNLGTEQSKVTKEISKALSTQNSQQKDTNTTPHTIARKLTEKKIKTPAGRDTWSCTSVRNILSNEKYKGDALLQKTFCDDFLTKKMKINQGEVPQYYVENNHEAIIDPQTFDMVQAELARRTEGNNRHSGVTSFHTKSSAVTAADGTVPRYGHSNDKFRRFIWQCNNKYKNKDKHCTTPYLDENQIKERFTIAVNKLLAGSSSAIRACEESLSTALDTSELEQKQQSLLTKMQTHDSALRQLIHRNATTAQDQN